MNTGESDARKPPGRDDLRQILFSCLRPAAHIAEEMELSLSSFRELAELAYYQRALRSELKKGQISKMFGIGLTKAAQLSKDLKQHFLESEKTFGLPRQILALLQSSPLTLAQLSKALSSFDTADIEDALETLQREARIVPIKGRTTRFAPAKASHRLSIVPWMARIDGLNTLMDHISRSIDARFTQNDARALVRNLSFQVSPEDVDKLQHFYEETLLPEIIALDQNAQRSEAPITYKLSVLWAPER